MKYNGVKRIGKERVWLVRRRTLGVERTRGGVEEMGRRGKEKGREGWSEWGSKGTTTEV